jgi:hypothetical protein
LVKPLDHAVCIGPVWEIGFHPVSSSQAVLDKQTAKVFTIDLNQSVMASQLASSQGVTPSGSDGDRLPSKEGGGERGGSLAKGWDLFGAEVEESGLGADPVSE